MNAAGIVGMVVCDCPQAKIINRIRHQSCHRHFCCTFISSGVKQRVGATRLCCIIDFIASGIASIDDRSPSEGNRVFPGFVGSQIFRRNRLCAFPVSAILLFTEKISQSLIRCVNRIPAEITFVISQLCEVQQFRRYFAF